MRADLRGNGHGSAANDHAKQAAPDRDASAPVPDTFEAEVPAAAGGGTALRAAAPQADSSSGAHGADGAAEAVASPIAERRLQHDEEVAAPKQQQQAARPLKRLRKAGNDGKGATANPFAKTGAAGGFQQPRLACHAQAQPPAAAGRHAPERLLCTQDVRAVLLPPQAKQVRHLPYECMHALLLVRKHASIYCAARRSWECPVISLNQIERGLCGGWQAVGRAAASGDVIDLASDSSQEEGPAASRRNEGAPPQQQQQGRRRGLVTLPSMPADLRRKSTALTGNGRSYMGFPSAAEEWEGQDPAHGGRNASGGMLRPHASAWAAAGDGDDDDDFEDDCRGQNRRAWSGQDAPSGRHAEQWQGSAAAARVDGQQQEGFDMEDARQPHGEDAGWGNGDDWHEEPPGPSNRC